MRMRWLAALLFAGGLAAGLGAGMSGTAHASDPTRPARPWNEIFLPFGNGGGSTMCVDVPGGTGCASGGRFYEMSNPGSDLCIGFPGGGAPVSGARLIQEGCDQAPAWQLVPQGRGSRDGADPHAVLETSGPGGPALCMTAGSLSGSGQAPLVAAPCQGFGNGEEILELG